MISLENAKRLKELGLEWEPQHGDFFHSLYTNFVEVVVLKRPEGRSCGSYNEDEGFIYLPPLSQLLKEVEERGYKWCLYTGQLRGVDKYYCDVIVPHVPIEDIRLRWEEDLFADTPEDAVALTLIRILEAE